MSLDNDNLDIEEVFEDNISLEDNSTFNSDPVTMWKKEIGKFPLLTPEEEISVGKDLKFNNGALYSNSILDLDKVFVLLENSKYSDEIINILHTLFLSINSESNKKRNITEKIEKYIRLKKQLGRCLNKDELLKYFNISENYILSDNLFLRDINNYVKYMTARDKMICSNLRLVVGMAGAYSYKTKIDFLDLVSEGSIGLIKAVERFDVDLGNKFSTFATWWIRQGMSRYIAKNIGTVKVPVNYRTEVKEFKQLVKSLEEKKGRQLTISEIVEATGVSREDVLNYLNYDVKTISLEQPVNDEEDSSTLGEFIPGDEGDVSEVVISEELKNSIINALDVLNPLEKKVVTMHFGIGLESGYSINDIAREMKRRPSRVTRLLNNALQKIRIHSKRNENIQRLELYLKDN